ncbi:hypothetical protein KBB27_04405 [Patescibacteria group bacterium]|nr:hypothetical protein [Patescibacteria group bacterium]
MRFWFCLAVSLALGCAHYAPEREEPITMMACVWMEPGDTSDEVAYAEVVRLYEAGEHNSLHCGIQRLGPRLFLRAAEIVAHEQVCESVTVHLAHRVAALLDVVRLNDGSRELPASEADLETALTGIIHACPNLYESPTRLVR